MRVPIQAKPIMRNVNTAKIESGICQSGLCETGCNLIPNATARNICLAACPVAGGLTGLIPGVGGIISHLF